MKKRFDEIFDSSRYSKALEVLAKKKKEYNGHVKDLKADVSGLSSHKHAAKGFQKEIQKYNKLMDDLDEEMQQIKELSGHHSAEDKRLRDIFDRLDAVCGAIEAKKSELKQGQAVLQKQRQMLQEDFTKEHNVRQLKEMLRDFDEEIDKQVERQQELQQEVSNRQKEVDKLRNQEKELQSRKGKLEAEFEAHQQRLKARYDKMMQMGEEHNLGSVLTQITQTQQSSPPTSQASSFRASDSIIDGGMDETHDEQQPMLNIPNEEMEEFFRVVAKKEAELKEEFSSFSAKHQREEDELQAQLTDLTGRVMAIESERKKLAKELADARKELGQMSSQVSSVSRTRKSDLEDLKRRSEQAQKDVETLSNNPRRNEIPTEIKSLDAKMDALSREIEDEQQILGMMRESSESEQAIAVLKEQCAKELDDLDEILSQQAPTLSKYSINPPDDLPGRAADQTGEDLNRVMDGLSDEVRAKFDAHSEELSQATDRVAKLQQRVSETTALVSHDKKALNTKRARMGALENGGVANVRKVVEEVKAYEKSIGMSEKNVDESQPQELLSHLAERLEASESESTEGIQPNTIKKVITRLKKQVRLTVSTDRSSLRSGASNVVVADRRSRINKTPTSSHVHAANET